jgi:fibronectin-binding autotransporter adhesin
MKLRILSAARLSFALATAIAALLATQSAHATIYYWDDNAATAGFGTAGASTDTWAAPTAGTVAGWSLSSAGTDAFAAFTTATTDTLNFGTVATGLAAGTITVSGTVDAGDMTFASGSGAIVLSGGTAINLAAVSTITVNNTTNTISSDLSGAGTSLTKAGTGTLILTGANTYTGATNLKAGTLTLSGASGALASTAINLNGGTFTLDNSSGTGNSGVRVSDSAAINVNGLSALNFTHNAGAVNYDETIETLSLQSGLLTYTGSQAAVDQTSNVLFNTLSRSGASNTSTVNFAGTGLGTDARNTIKFGAGVTDGTDLGPWAVVNGVDFATYDTTLGVKAAATTALTSSSNSSTTNFKITTAGPTLTAGGNPSFKTVQFNSTATRTLGIQANIVSVGGISSIGANNVMTGSLGGGGAFQALAAGDPFYVHVAGNQLTIQNVPIRDFGGGGTPSALVKSGPGILLLSGTHTYSGGTVLNAGTITVTSDTNLGAAGVGITFNGSATLTPGTASFSSARSITINNNAIATFGRADGTATFSGNLTGTGGIAMGSSSTTEVIFSGTENTFEGKIAIGFDGPSARGYRFAFASLADSATANGRIVFSRTVSSSVANGSVFEYTGSAPLVLDNRQIEIASVAANPTLGHQIRSSGTGTLTVNTDLIVSTAVAQTLALRGTNTGNNTFAGKIGNGSGGSAIVSLLKNDAGLWILSGANTYSGTTTISGGTLALSGGSNILADTNAVNISNAAGIFNISAVTTSETIGSLTGVAGSSVVLGSKNLTVGDATNTAYAGVISGESGTLTKQGGGTLTLSGANTYTGATAVSVGTLLINGSTSSTSLVTVAANATLGGIGTVGGHTTISGTHNPGNSPGIQTFTGNLSYVDGGIPNPTVNWELASNTTTVGVNPAANFDQIIVGGNLDFTDLTTINLSFNGAGSDVLWTNALWTTDQSWLLYDVAGTTSNFGNLTLNTINWLDSGSNSFNTANIGSFTLGQSGHDVVLNFTAVPEPRAALLGGLGLLMLLRRRRR